MIKMAARRRTPCLVTILSGLPLLCSTILPRRGLGGKRSPAGKSRLYAKNSPGWERFGLDHLVEKSYKYRLDKIF
jgi:hypothetical protein